MRGFQVRLVSFRIGVDFKHPHSGRIILFRHSVQGQNARLDANGIFNALPDRRSKAFIHQASDLVAELRRFGLNLQRINRARVVTQLALLVAGIVIGELLSRLL